MMRASLAQISVIIFVLPLGCHRSQAPARTGSSPASPVVGSSDTKVVRLDPALDNLIAPGTMIERLARGFQFSEGPMWREGRLWFSDLVGNRMYAVDPGGKVELLLPDAGGLVNVPPASYKGSNAMVTDKDGTVLMCRHGMRDVVRLDGSMHILPFLSRYEGKRFNSPNDLVFAPDGSLWITDPPFGLNKQDADASKEIPFSGVYRYAQGKLTAMIKDLPRPNGIGFSPDGKTLYVSNTAPHMFVNRYDVHGDGSLGPPSILISYPDQATQGVPDGLKVDSTGNIWTTGPRGIRIVTPQGKVLGQLELPEVAANLAWADAGHVVYITATSSIYRLKLATTGKMPLYSR